MSSPSPSLPLKPFRNSLRSSPMYSESFSARPRRKRVNPFRDGDVIEVNFPSGIPMRWRIKSISATDVQVESLPNLTHYTICRVVLIEMAKDERVSIVPREVAVLLPEIAKDGGALCES